MNNVEKLVLGFVVVMMAILGFSGVIFEQFIIPETTTVFVQSHSESTGTNHNGEIWNITSNMSIHGHHFNISKFIVQSNVTLSVDKFNGSNDTGWYKINTSHAEIYGILDFDGKGHGGGSGGGGGGGDGACTNNNHGFGGGQTDQLGQNGTNGVEGNDGCNGNPTVGGVGGSGFNGTTGGVGGTAGVSSSLSNGGPGDNGDNATPTNNTALDFSANLSNAGGAGGGGGGGGGNSLPGNVGGGGSGGGIGQDAPGYGVIIAKFNLTMNGTIIARGGLVDCLNNGTTGTGQSGVDGGTNNVSNCQRSFGGSSNVAPAGDGGAGGNGGFATGGQIVLAGGNVDLAGALINVTGGMPGDVNGGIIKVFFSTNGTIVNGTYTGYVNLTVTNITSSALDPLDDTPPVQDDFQIRSQETGEITTAGGQGVVRDLFITVNDFEHHSPIDTVILKIINSSGIIEANITMVLQTPNVTGGVYNTTYDFPSTGNYVFNMTANDTAGNVLAADLGTTYFVDRRHFDVFIEGIKVENDYVIKSAAGGINTAVVEEYNFTVLDGAVTINFVPEFERPIVAAIEIIERIVACVDNNVTTTTGQSSLMNTTRQLLANTTNSGSFNISTLTSLSCSNVGLSHLSIFYDWTSLCKDCVVPFNWRFE